MSIDAHSLMNHLLTSFEQNTHPEGGWYIETALRRLPWNQRFNSLKAFDNLISSYRNKRGVSDGHAFLSDVAKRNTLLLLAAYLGKVLQHSTGARATWYYHADFVAANPAEHQHFAHTFNTALVLKLGEQWVLPVSLLCDQLFEAETQPNISHHIANIIQRELYFQSQNPTDAMHLLLQLVHNQAQVPGGLAHADTLQAHDWDYSIFSLDRLDQVLQQVRSENTLSPDTWFKDSSEANFLMWASAYLASTIANMAQASLRWWNHTDTSRLMQQDLPETLASTRVAQIDQTLYFVLGYVSDYLLGNNEKSVSQYGQFVLAQLHNFPQTPLKPHSQATASVPSLWKNAMVNAGQTAAHMLQQLVANPSQQAILLPTLCDGGSFVQAMDKGETVEQHWHDNPNQRAYLSLAYEAHAFFATERMDAIQIDTLVEDGSGHEFSVGITVPFYAHSDYRGFQIARPYFTQLPPEQHQQWETLGEYFFNGVQKFEQTHAPFWKSYYSGVLVS